MSSNGGIARADLLAAVAAAGRPVTPAQLERWHKRGLLPAPVQVYVPGARGSRSLYPPGTERQLLRLAELRQRRRSLDELTFELWWEGWEIPIDLARHALQRFLPGPLTEHGEKVARRDVDRVMQNPKHPWRRLLKLHGLTRSEAEAAVSILAEYRLGEPIEWQPDYADDEGPDPQDVLYRAMGMVRASTESIPGQGSWLRLGPAEFVRALVAVRPAGSQGPLITYAAIDAASDEDLEIGRTVARTICEVLAPGIGRLEQQYGVGAFGLQVMSLLIDAPVWMRAGTLVVALLMLRHYGAAELLQFRDVHQLRSKGP